MGSVPPPSHSTLLSPRDGDILSPAAGGLRAGELPGPSCGILWGVLEPGRPWL